MPDARIDPLDPTGGVVGCGQQRPQPAVLLDPGEATIVADIERAVGSDRHAVGTAAGARDGLDGAVGTHAGHPAALDLDQRDRAIGEGDGSLGETQPRGDGLQFGGWLCLHAAHPF